MQYFELVYVTREVNVGTFDIGGSFDVGGFFDVSQTLF